MTIAVTRDVKHKQTKRRVPEVFTSFFKLILKKSADENKSKINYPACNELTPFSQIVLPKMLLISAADIQV